MGDIPGPGIKPTSLAPAGKSFTTEPPGKHSSVHFFQCCSHSVLIATFWAKSDFIKVMFSKMMGGLPRWHSVKGFTCQCKRHRKHGFHLWVRKFPWSREWQPTLVFSPGKFHGQRSLAGNSPWSFKESDMTEGLNTHTRWQENASLS